MKPTLVILAAGMASRYGSQKQTASFGPSGETIMDYSIYDAISAGFEKVVFIIREDFAENFKAIFEPKLAGKIKTDYVYQHLNAFVGGRVIPADRTKPWGTAHAVLCCKGKVNEPFAVINADDYYGADAFIKAYDFLLNQCNEKTYCIIGYELKKTLSDFGSVSRGVCEVDADNNLTDINERTKIYRNDAGIIHYEDESGLHELNENSLVSMNYLCFAPGFIDVCEKFFGDFLDNNMQNLKSEFFIPSVTGQFIKAGLGNVKVVPTSAQWFGVTYKEDAPHVQASINALVDAGNYPKSLWD
ncbi:MAG: nucleotidyltransferase [Sediminibacterium sp.]|jgi:NDP-sugar pyrophosphorylase family protein|nr:MAG: nucleotidyltransferase [Sediminibacterium sp.]